MAALRVTLSFPEPTPVAGDIVLRRRDGCPSQYDLCPDPAPPQIRCGAYDAAVRIAKRWACHEHVDVWVFEGEHSFALVSRHRRDATLLSDRAERDAVPHPGFRVGDVFALGRPNALLIGENAATRALMAVFRPDLSTPVAEWDPSLDACPPPLDSGTLIIWNADAMPARSQGRLLDIVRDHRGSLQVISIAGRELFDCVQRGEFVEELYYCLNVVCLRLRDA